MPIVEWQTDAKALKQQDVIFKREKAKFLHFLNGSLIFERGVSGNKKVKMINKA